MKQFVQKIGIITVIVLLFLSIFIVQPLVYAKETDNELCNSVGDDVVDLFAGKKNGEPIDQVYLGGYPLGITIDGEGVVVIGLHEFIDMDGKLCCPALKCGLQINDTILELDGKMIYGSSKLAEISLASGGKPLTLKYLRDGNSYTTTIIPQIDLATHSYRLGLWTKDVSSGVGTLTYTKRNLNFGALGHPICNSNGKIIKCTNGGVFHCNIDGVLRGQKGAAGELKGTFSFDKRIGNVYCNNRFGTFGTFLSHNKYCNELIDVADICDVHPGKASIFCTLKDGDRKEYEIEIVKANMQKSPSDKGMVIHVTDKDLIASCGGIVQGMSGSPIVQDGRLVGAVTHVFVNDPTRGYGIYAKWMLEN